MRIRPLAAVLAVAGLLAALPGCLVPLSKYRKLQEDRDRVNQMLDERESELAAAQDAFRKRAEDISRELELYKKQASASEAEAEEARQALEAAQREAQQFQKELESIGVGTVRDGRLVLQAALLFPLGSAQLSPQGQRALDKVADAFRGKDVLIQIDGHTDTTPIVKEATKEAHGDNMGLSAHRAVAVYRHLAKRGIPKDKMYVRGFGPSWPVASNATPESRAKNRRVEILFIPESMAPRPGGQ
ncbi:MAG: flagellar motor protein MotB [Candidatus Brocadiia bacterium]